MNPNNPKPAKADQDWRSNPKLQGIDPEKLNKLMELVSQNKGKSPSELLPILMLAAKNNKNGLHFSEKETNTILEVLKIGKSPTEIAKMNQMIQVIKMLR